MADALPPELVGKWKRVAGVFVFMIGASIILDTHAAWVGVPLLAVGAALVARGLAEAREGRTAEPLVGQARDTTTEVRP